MTFLVIKEQNFHFFVSSVGVYARKTGESGKCNGTWPNRSSISIPMQPRPQGFSVNHPFFKGKALGTRLIAVLLRTGAITKWRNTKDWKDAEQYSHHNTKANQQWLLQPLFQCLRFEPPPRPNYKNNEIRCPAAGYTEKGSEKEDSPKRIWWQRVVKMKEGNLYNDKLNSWHKNEKEKEIHSRYISPCSSQSDNRPVGNRTPWGHVIHL